MAEARAKARAEAQAMEEHLALLQEDIRLRFLMKDEGFSGMSEAERAAKQAKAKEERLGLIRECTRLYFEKKDPDYSGMSEAERAAEAERRRQEALQEARRLQMEGHPMGRRREALAHILDFDPKQWGDYYNRFSFVDLTTFDLDEESPLGPMRFTDAVYKNKRDYQLCHAVNILSIKIACSDVGFPIHVYGTVIARDSVDEKCLYLFRRDRNHCQVINSEDESLILTGPKRGLALLDDNYVETDLKIKDHRGQDRDLSKGILTIRGIAGRSLKCEVQSHSLATRLSTVDVMYAVVKRAVEATIAIEVLQGDFYGKITAHTTSIQNRLVLYDSEGAGAMTGDGHGVIQLVRPVVSVCVKDMLIIVAQTGGGRSECIIEFTPRVNSRDDDVITVGVTKMRVMVAWSIMDP
ncbi:uncharacterized protein LOC133888908 [Phragmites australis]|uniref:uncharacterized protein LOC133888908 n=1 Tax=Phragmites australis TaxID=29695 RepID=UPI002D782C65|nr:uncharacterized protein LOC133888908 [Phragmites australis]